MSGEHEQEGGDNMPLIYAALAENRRILLAHEREQDAIEGTHDLRAELATIRAAMDRDDRINACQHDEDDGRCICCEADAEYMVPPQWVRD